MGNYLCYYKFTKHYGVTIITTIEIYIIDQGDNFVLRFLQRLLCKIVHL